MQSDCSKNSEQTEKEAQFFKYSAFRSTIFKVKNVETAILLLQSEDKSTLLTAIEILFKYIDKSKDNAKMLFHLSVVNKILPVIDHKDIIIRRFAGKLLIEMTVIPDVTSYLIESDYLIYFIKLLKNEKDIFMQEYLSIILAKLSEDLYGNALLAHYSTDINLFLERSQSSDPDIKKHNLEILHNLMQDLVAAHEILRIKKFNFFLLYQHFESSYPEIQYLALDITADVISRNKDKDVQFLFHETNGVKVLLDFLKNNNWSDLHIKALEVLCFATENSAIVGQLIESGDLSQILNYIKCTKNTRLFVKALKIAIQIANISKGRKILYSYKIVECLINALQQPMQSDIVEITCYGIGKMALLRSAAKEFANTKSIETILDLLKKENLQWPARHAASFAIKQLLISDIKNCNIFLDINGPDFFRQLLKSSVEQISIEICIVSLEILLATAHYLIFRDTLISFDMIEMICFFLESIYPLIDEFKIACCNLLSTLCLEKNGRHNFIKANGPQKMFALITDSYSLSVRNAALQFVQTISTDLTIAKAFVKNNYLSYMLNNRLFSKVIPLWDTCIQTLLKSHLPVKFAITGHLSLHDITQDGFYVSRTNVCPFPILDDIFRYKICPLEPIYVINCVQSTSSILQNETVLKGDTNEWFESKFGQLHCDPHFVEYVEDFKHLLLATELKQIPKRKNTENQYIVQRAKMLARFVARQMSGVDSTEIECINQQLEVHLKKIKECLETSVIPLGQLRVGSYLERALLFKAIADRICLPAALVRGEYGISWIEIAIPEIIEDLNKSSTDLDKNVNKDNQDEIIFNTLDSNSFMCQNEYEREKVSLSRDHQSAMYPTKLIRPNFIVDLMNKPGDLIPIGSSRSKLYCVKKIAYNKTCY